MRASLGRPLAGDRLKGVISVTFDIERAASLLLEGRRQHRQVEPFAPGPASADDAYRVQDAVARRLGPLGGWKVGAKAPGETPNAAPLLAELIDRKSTRLNSSHVEISYAVFCLKKK